MELEEVELRPQTAAEFTSAYWSVVQNIARNLNRQYGVVDAEDIAQGIWERAIPRFEKEYKELGDDALRRVLHRHGRDVVNKESLDYMYYSGSYLYTPQEVRVKLDSCTWADLEKCPDMDARVDLQGAFLNLAPKQRIAVYKRYALKEPSGSMSEAESRNERRGVDNITHYLNRGVGASAARLDSETDRAAVEEFILASMDFRGANWGVSSDYGGEYR